MKITSNQLQSNTKDSGDKTKIVTLITKITFFRTTLSSHNLEISSHNLQLKSREPELGLALLLL